MRRDEQLDDMERTISRIRMDNDAMREEISNWKAEVERLRKVIDLATWIEDRPKETCPLCIFQSTTASNLNLVRPCSMHRRIAEFESKAGKG